ncbi:MAG: T9SS type A sorting domain-containing protein [Bacteroidetes bacterium]|nr:MAG: T9SS type A sorting domain-containing protein [Bacteroidota bacterium]
MNSTYTNRKYLNMKRKLYLAALLLTGSVVSAQTHDHSKCMTDEHYQQQIQSNPEILQRSLQFEQDVEQMKVLLANKQLKNGQKFIIPVVFHVFHAGGSENISKAQVQNQLDTFNKLFNNVFPERVRDVFHGVIANCEIEFRLATKDPDGNCTDGVVRIYDPETENGSNNLKYKSAWPTDRYLNIWVVKEINSASASLGTTLGYAQFPWAGGAQTDGIVVRHDNVGAIGTATTGLGVGQWARTLVHEAGHWLGLYHPFQDSCFGGDGVEDTPPVSSPSFGCDLNRNTCTNEAPGYVDRPDMIENYMDYADGRCMWAFTIGQKLRMQTTLLNWRPKLWSASNLEATGVADPYSAGNCGPKANFYTLNAHICQGANISFVNDTYNHNAGGVTYEWSFPGGSPSTSTSANPVVNYAESGQYNVQLIAKKTVGGVDYADTMNRVEFINVYNSVAMFGAGLTENFEFPVFPVNGWSYSSTTNVNFRRFATGAGSLEGSFAVQVPNSEIQDGAAFYLETPTLDLSVLPSPMVSFYYAFAQRRKQNGTTSFDALSVSSSVNCGQTWSSRWNSAGSQLSTTGGVPFVSVNFVPSGVDQWKKVEVSLSAIPAAQRNNVRLRFEFRSRGGHNLFIDQINLGFSSSIGEHLNSEANFTVFPNPASTQATVKLNMPSQEQTEVEVYDLMGKKVAVLHTGVLPAGEKELTFNGTGLSSGMYIVKVTAGGSSSTRKVMLTGSTN